jgi:2-amino-4-hydroxy-6-hydroxymethyldihydropteridine diphosphokinase
MQHPVYLLLGSNIQPEANIRAALVCLQATLDVHAVSPVWETTAIGSDGPNFLNLVVKIATSLDPEELKLRVLRPIESKLGRVRKADKNAPRTIDLDILIYDCVIIEPNVWLQAYIACPLAGLLPDIKHAQTGATLAEVAAQLAQIVPVHLRDDLLIQLKPHA